MLLVKAGLFVLVAFGATVSFAQTQYEQLIIFGDSLSDTGNIASVTTDFPFPYFENRISDGPVAVDYLAAAIGTTAQASRHTSTPNGGDNFAIAGANIVGDDVEDLSAQVSAYLSRETGQANPRALYFVMIGGNDLRGLRSVRSSSLAAVELERFVDGLVQQLERLSAAGARHFFISNVANIGRVPETLALESADPGVSNRARLYSQDFNRRLVDGLGEFSNAANVRLAIFDLYLELEKVVTNAASLGFTQTDVGCFSIDGFSFHPDCRFGTRFDRFIFFDNIHPSGTTHRLVGTELASQVPPMLSIPTDQNALIAALVALLLDE